MAGILSSNADLSQEEGQAAVIRDLERHQLILDSLVSTGDSASNNSTIDDGIISGGTPAPVLIDGIFKTSTVTVTGGAITDVSAGPSLTDGTYNNSSVTIFGNQVTSVTAGPSLSNGTYAAATVTVSGNQISSVATGPFLSQLTYPVYNNGGNSRGTSAVDWQQSRSLATQVASGNFSVVSGGQNNIASGLYSGVASGYLCTASGDYSVAAGNNATASGQNSVCLSNQSTASGAGAACIGGFFQTAQGSSSITLGGNNTTVVSGDYSISAMGGTYTFSGRGSFSFGDCATPSSLRQCDNSFILPMNTTSPTSLAQSIFYVGTGNNLITTGSGTISNSAIMHGGSILSTSPNTGSLSNSFALNGGITCPSSGTSSGIFCVSGSVVCANAVTSLCSINSAVTNTVAVTTANITAINSTVDCNGKSNFVAIGSTITTPVSGCFYIGISSSIGYTPATGATICLDLGCVRNFGCNGRSPQGTFASGGAIATTAGGIYTGTEQAMLNALKLLANNIRTALVNNGIMS